jgi:hypothetical protein
MAEYRVSITISEQDETCALPLLESLESHCRETGPIMVRHVDVGTFEYVLGIDANNALEACSDLGGRFVRAAELAGLENVTIVGLDGHAVPADEVDEFAAHDLEPA